MTSFCRECHASKVAIHSDRVLSTEAAVTMMEEAQTTCLNKERINGVSCNAIFLCPVRHDTDRFDLRRDGMGVWEEGHRTTKVPFKGTSKCPEVQCDSHVWRLTYKCKSLPTLKKIEIYRKDLDGKLMSPVFIQYMFSGKPQSIKVLPHGNSKTGLPFHPTDRSLLNEMHKSTRGSEVSSMKVYNKVSRLKSFHCVSIGMLTTLPQWNFTGISSHTQSNPGHIIG